MSVGGIVLCGGRSSRMGRPKLALPFGPELMLPRVVRILSEVVSPVVVVAAPDQDVSPLPHEVVLVRDEREGMGPMAGLAVGLAALRQHADVAFVSACDAPLLRTAFIRRMIDLLGDLEIAIPIAEGFPQPLSAVYRTSLAERARELLEAGQLRLSYLFDTPRTRKVPGDTLRDVDPELHSLWNTNTPEAYAAALREAGFESSDSNV